MEFFDIINFKDERVETQAFNFKKIYQYNEIQDKIVIGNPERIIKYMRKGEILYCPSYEISLEMFAKAGALNRPFLICLSDILLHRSLAQQAQHVALYRISNFIRVARHYRIKFIFASMANNIYYIRDPEEAASILKLCGMTREQVFQGYSLLKRYIEK